jgi:hypothetical protein
MEQRYHLAYYSLTVIDRDFDDDGAMIDVFHHDETFEDSSTFYSHAEHFVRDKNQVAFALAAYMFTTAVVNSSFSLITENKNELMEFIRFLIDKYHDFSVEITEFKTLQEALIKFDKETKNLN